MDLLAIIICLGMLVTFTMLPMLAIGALAGADYRGVRQLLRERRFGLFSIFLATAAVAIALGLLRGFGADFADPGVVCFGAFALMIGVVVVGLAWLALSDRLERGESKKLRQRMLAPDVQVGPPVTPEIPLAELIEGSPSEVVPAEEIVAAELADE